MRFVFVALSALFFCCDAQAQVVVMGANSSKNSSPQKTAGVFNVSVNLTSLQNTIPSNFVGIRGEVGDFVNGLYQGTTGANGSFMNIAKMLGANGVFSLGGNSAENATAPTITSGMASNLNSFLLGIGAGWTLSYDLDSVANNSSAAATTATTIASAVGTANVVFQFGNEPSTNWTQSNYITLWNSYYTAVTGAVSGVKLAATDDGMLSGTMNQQSTFAALTGGSAGLQYISSHYYSSASCAVLVSATVLLATVTKSNPFTNFEPWSNPSQQRMTETNTICGKGFPGGNSDRLMASTWYIDTAIILASAGWLGMNTQSYYLGQSYYNIANQQADTNYLPSPIFYGMLLFSKIEGQQIATSSITTSSVNDSSTLLAMATKGVNGNANIIVANNDTVNPAIVVPSQSSGWSSASVLAVTSGAGNGCSDFTAKIGGKAIGESGVWTGSSYTITNGQSISLGPCESAFIQILP